MTQIEKLVERLRREKGLSSFSDVRRLLEHNGWRLSEQRGSHVKFSKRGEQTIRMALVSGRWIKRIYVVNVLRIVGGRP